MFFLGFVVINTLNAEERFFNKKIVTNLPFYLSLIEFSQARPETLTEAKQQLLEQKKLNLQKNLSLNPFHQRNSLSLKEKLAVSEQTFCATCHLPLPHQTNIRTRTFNNMHSRYIACETCHFDEDKLPKNTRLAYQWFDYQNRVPMKASGDLFKIDKNQKQKMVPSAIKIVPFYQGRSAIITKQHIYTEKLIETWEQGDINQNAAIKVRTHQPLKEEGTQCLDCHTQSAGILDIAALGAGKEQLEAYQNNTIAEFFKHYKDNSNRNDAAQADTIERIRITELLQ